MLNLLFSLHSDMSVQLSGCMLSIFIFKLHFIHW